MGRRSEPVDGEIQELVALAVALRELRRAAGNPPLRTMAMRARYSASTLSEATSGRRLPTLPVVLAFVTACGVDPAGWEERWKRVSAAVQTDNEASPRTGVKAGQAGVNPARPGSTESREGASDEGRPPGAAQEPLPSAPNFPDRPGAEPPEEVDSPLAESVADQQTDVRTSVATSRSPRLTGRFRRRAVWWSLGGTVLALALIGYLTGLGPVPSARPSGRHLGGVASSTPATTAAGSVITEDTDPQDTGCDKGRVDTLASANLYGPDRFFVGYVWLRYAPACNAAWPRFEPAAGMAELSRAEVTVRIVRPADGRALSYTAPYLGLFEYGNMLRFSHGCLRAEATVSAPHPSQGPASALAGPVAAHAETQCVLPSGTRSTVQP